MGTGNLQMPHKQVTDHRLGPSQGIDATAGAIGRQVIAGGIFREAGHHGNGCGSGLLEAITSTEQRIGRPQTPPAGTTGPPLQGDIQRLIGGHHRPDLQAKGGATPLRHLNLSLGQLRIDTGIEQQANGLTPDRIETPCSGCKTIEAVALHVVDAGIAPVERRTVHHIGVGDQATTGCRQQAGAGEGITGIPTDFTADPRGHQHQHGQRLNGHARTTASTLSQRRPDGSRSTAVMAQRNGSPSRLSCSRTRERSPWAGMDSGQAKRRSSRHSFTSGTDRTALHTAHPPDQPSGADRRGERPHTSG